MAFITTEEEPQTGHADLIPKRETLFFMLGEVGRGEILATLPVTFYMSCLLTILKPRTVVSLLAPLALAKVEQCPESCTN